jgi:multidrug efflux pump subunit AcrA (membrane-fusion protein)
MTTTLKIALPILVVALGVAGAAVLISARPEVETQRPDLPAPLVRVMTVKTEDLELRVLTQGTVAPRTESTLLPEVVGRVVSASEAFEDGGFFEEGEILLTIDPRDYELAAVRAHPPHHRSAGLRAGGGSRSRPCGRGAGPPGT